MAEAIEQKIPPASQRVVGEWVARTAAESLARHVELLKQIEISEISVPAIIADETGGATGTGSRPPSTYAGIALAAAPQAKPRGWRDRRAVMGGAGAALLLLVVIVLAASRRGPPAGTGQPREEIGTTVIQKGEAATARVEPIPQPSPAEAPPPAGAPAGATTAPAGETAAAAEPPSQPPSRKHGGQSVKDLRAERDHGASRKAVPAGHPGRAHLPGGAGSTSAPAARG